MCLYVFIDVHMKAPLIQLNKESKYTMVTFMNICAKITNKDYLLTLGQRKLISNTMNRKHRDEGHSFLGRLICYLGGINGPSPRDV